MKRIEDMTLEEVKEDLDRVFEQWYKDQDAGKDTMPLTHRIVALGVRKGYLEAENE